MPDILRQEFIEKFENTTYPFIDSATLKDINDTFSIPKALFVDASLYPPGVKNNLYISRIVIAIDSAEIVIGEENSTNTFTGTVSTTEDNVWITDSYNRIVGILCADKSRLSYLFACKSGTYIFTPKATTFSSRCVFQDPGRGVSSIGSGSNDLNGYVWLIGGDGVFLRNDNNKIRIDIAGEVLHKLSSCDTLHNYETKNYLRTINNTPPDIYGDIAIGQRHQDFNTALRVVQSDSETIIKTI